MKEVISAGNTNAPYSPAIRAGNFVFVSGQLPTSPETGAIEADTIAAQTRQSLENVGAVLKLCGLTYSDVVKTTVFLTDMSKFAEMNSVYTEFFSSEAPARSAIQVVALPKGAMVEIEAIATK